MDDTTRSVGGTGAPREPGADPDVERRTSEIRRDIAQTRGEMSETIEAIEEKLRPGNIVSSATDRVREAATEKVRNMKHSAANAYDRMRSGSGADSGSFFGEIRQNPIPAMLIGIGSAWLLMNRRSGNANDRGTRRQMYDTAAPAAGDYAGLPRSTEAVGLETDDYEETEWSEGYRVGAIYRTDDAGRSTGNGFMERVQENPLPAALAAVGLGWLALSGTRGWDDGAQERNDWRYGENQGGSADSSTSGVRDTISNATSSVADGARRLTSQAQDYTRSATGQARARGRQTQSQLQRMARENPLMVGAGALLLGAAVGLAIPETEREHELLGEARDSMIDRAQEMAGSAATRAQETAADLAGEAASRIISGKEE